VDTLFQQFINGLSLGAIYALIALGYTMVYGVLRLINFAHGDVYMLGAFAGYFIANALNMDEHPSTGFENPDVPPYITVGTRIVILTEDGSYQERAKD